MITRCCVLSDALFRDLKFKIWGLKIKFLENYFFLKNYALQKELFLTAFYTCTFNLSPHYS